MTSTARQATAARRTRIAVCGALAAGMMLVAASPAWADPAVSQPIDDVANDHWDGAITGAHLGDDSLDNIGDINGDGRDDVLASTDAPRDSLYVLFSPPAGGTDLDDLPPSRGYSILVDDSSPNGIGIADQNDDGIPDLLMVSSSSDDEVAVVYGIVDPSGLPQCDPGGATRCLDSETLTTDDGYTISAPSGSLDTANLADAGDFNGDGVGDIVLGERDGPVDREAAYIVYGGRTPTGAPVDLPSLPASEALRIDAPAAGESLGFVSNGVGDLNGDGRDDIAVGSDTSSTATGFYVIYGAESASSPMSTEGFGPPEGFRVLWTPGITVATIGSAGDVNGDGRPDLIAGMVPFLTPPGKLAVVYGPEDAPSDPIPADPVDPGAGYILAVGENPIFGVNINGAAAPPRIGDLDGDGVPDFLTVDPQGSPGGVGSAGSAHVVFGKDPAPASPAVFDGTLTPDQGIALIGQTTDAQVGHRVDSAGDVDQDGLPDFVVSAPETIQSGVSEAGSVYLVLGRDLVGEASTGQAGKVKTSSATLGGSGRPNGRPSVAYFEYGTTDQFGQQTSDQDIGDNNATQSVDADVGGLQPNTTYHYRLVVENELGLKRYGNDRTFTTDAEDIGGPPAPLPGQAGLDVTANPPSKKVKKGKKRARFTAEVRNTGGVSAQGVQLCVESSKTGKKGLKGTGCESVGSLGANSSTKSPFRLKPKKKAKGKHRLTFTATAAGVSDSTDTADLQVKKKRGKR